MSGCFCLAVVLHLSICQNKWVAERGLGVVVGQDSGRAGLAAVGTWHQQLLLFSLPGLQPLLSEDLGEVSHCSSPLCCCSPHACHCILHFVEQES